jgi:hypothetical protein
VVYEYYLARARHAVAREEAYAFVRDDAMAGGISGPALRLADIDENALTTWRTSWRGHHPSGAGRWDWARLVDQLPHRAAVMPLAMWHGDDLCGLALGHLSRSRLPRRRHTMTLTRIERRPEPPAVALRGRIAVLAISAAVHYGNDFGASRLRLANPDPRLLKFYRSLGFQVVWKGERPIRCEREI